MCTRRWSAADWLPCRPLGHPDFSTTLKTHPRKFTGRLVINVHFAAFFRADVVLQQKQIQVLSGMHPLLVQKSFSTHKLRV